MRSHGVLDRGLLWLWAPVVGVAALTQAQLGLEEPWAGSDLALAVTSLVQSVPLLARRHAPLLTAGAIAAALPLQEALGGTLSFGTFVAVLVSAYALGRHTTPAWAASGVGVLLVGVGLAVREELPEAIDELVFPLFYISASAALGAVVRRLRTQADELHALNAALARERDATVRLAVAGERMRLSRDLHDSVAHTLTVAVVQAQNCEQLIDADPAAARTAARAVAEAGRHGLSELRAVVRVLRDLDTPRAEPTLADVSTLADVVAEAGLQVEVSSSGELQRVPDPAARALFRVVQESLTNVIKHSAAGHAIVTVTITHDAAEVAVVDPGPARTSELVSGGHGLAGMAERLAAIGGRVEAAPQGTGYGVRATVPLAPSHAGVPS